jgi:hypothetical protein
MKNVRDEVYHALRHGVVSLKSLFFVVDYYWQIKQYNNIIDFFDY